MPNLNVDSESRLTTEKAENVFCLLSTPHWNHLDNCQQLSLVRGFPGGAAVKNPPASGRKLRRCGFNPWVEKIP